MLHAFDIINRNESEKISNQLVKVYRSIFLTEKNCVKVYVILIHLSNWTGFHLVWKSKRKKKKKLIEWN